MNGAPSFGLINLASPAIVLLGVIFLTSQGRLTRLTGIRARLFIFTLGIVYSVLSTATLSENFLASFRWFNPLAHALQWVLYYEIARLFLNRLPRRPIVSLLIAAAFVVVIRVPVASYIYLFYYSLSAGSGIDMQRLIDQFPEGIVKSFEIVLHYPYYVFVLVDTATLIGVIYCVNEGHSLASRSKTQKFWQTGAFGCLGGPDMEMTSSKSHTTRLLCASALLNSSFRDQVLNLLADRNKAAAPEIGMNLPLIATVCQYARNRERLYGWIYLACFGIAAIGFLVHPVIGAALLLLAGSAVYFHKNWNEQFRLVRYFKRDAFNAENAERQFAAHLEPEAYLSLPSEDQNLVVYESFSPFVGAGMNLDGWSFVVNVQKGKEENGRELDPLKFEVAELYDDVDQAIDALELAGLSHRDMFFVNGTDIRDDSNILPDCHGHPVQKIPEDRFLTLRNTNDRRIRHYQWIKVMDWGNELCTSYFFRCTLRGPNLFVEINRYLLTPLGDSYRKIDAMAKQGWKHGLGIAIASLFLGPMLAAFSPLVLLHRINEAIEELFDKKGRERRKLINENPLYNYGANNSLREQVSGGVFMHYFQKLDGVFYSKVLEREILAAIVDFLEAHDIDTSELKERQSTILNSGIIVQGGDVNAQSLAVGSGAQAIHVAKKETPPKPKVRRQKEVA